MEYRFDNTEIDNENARTVIKGYPGGGNSFGGMNFEPEKPKKEINTRKTSKKRGAGLVVAIIAICVACAVGGSLLTAFVFMPAYINNQVTAQVSKQIAEKAEAYEAQEEKEKEIFNAGDETEPYASDKDSNAVEYVAEIGVPGVVSIYTYQESQDPYKEETSLNDLGYGSGFIINEDGYIVTNYHVIENADVIKVRLYDGDEYTAEIAGKDYESDIAVLKIESDEKLAALKIGDSDKCKVGQMVVAIGNPIGENLAGTVTVGYISSLDREIKSANRVYNVLQMDAAINPGNSGGPLFNLEGEVVGMNTLKSLYAGITPQGTTINSEGIGFAIPINYVKDIALELIEKGSIEKAGIGMTYYDITPEEAEKWQVPEGFLVMSMVENGPAYKAGLQVNDVVIAIDGNKVHDEGFILADYLKQKGIGAQVILTVWRAGNEVPVPIVLANINAIE